MLKFEKHLPRGPANRVSPWGNRRGAPSLSTLPSFVRSVNHPFFVSTFLSLSEAKEEEYRQEPERPPLQLCNPGEVYLTSQSPGVLICKIGFHDPRAGALIGLKQFMYAKGSSCT